MRAEMAKRRIAMTSALMEACLMSLPSTAAGATVALPLCEVTNSTAGTAVTDDLQRAIDSAKPSDVLRIKGVCVGSYSVSKSISLVGAPSSPVPVPALDGADAGTVLTLLGQKEARISVTIRDLTIRNGLGGIGGGGIESRRADVVLDGTTAVIGNQAQHGAGIFFTLGSLTLGAETRVAANQAYAIGGYGGGVQLRRGALALRDGATVTGNSATVGGGIYTYKGSVLLRDDSSVASNHASEHAGGIFSYDAPVRVRKRATVQGNDAQAYGGGVYLGGYRDDRVSLTVTGHASVTQNTTARYGGGIAASLHGLVTLKRHALVSDNVANVGGGIHSAGVVVFRDESSVVGNTAQISGGGLFSTGTVTFWPDWLGTVCGNSPDDWPSCAS